MAVYQFRDLLFWAEGGCVCLEDANTGEYVAVTVSEFRRRMRAIQEEMEHIETRAERREYALFLEHADIVCRQAEEQGNPENPEHLKVLIEKRRRSRIIVPLDGSSPVWDESSGQPAASSEQQQVAPETS